MKKVALLILFVATSGSALPFSLDRRAMLGAAATTVWTTVVSPAQAVLSSKYCASGTGEGCADLSEGNELIRRLQEKSAANRERNERVRSWKYLVGTPTQKHIVSEVQLDSHPFECCFATVQGSS